MRLDCRFFSSSLPCALLAIASCTAGCSDDSTTDSPQTDAINGVDTATGDVGIDTTPAADTGATDTTKPPIDTAIDDTGPADSGDTGSVCATGEWRDFATSTCVACTETPPRLTCTDMIISDSGDDFDQTKSVLSFTIKPSIAEVVSGTASFTIEHSTGADTTSDIPVTVSGNVISMNLASIFLDVTLKTVILDKLVLVDRCGVSSTPTGGGPRLNGQIDIGEGIDAAFFCSGS